MDQKTSDTNGEQNVDKELRGHIDRQKDEREQQQLKQKMDHVRRKVMVMSGKGGVGKSTVAINLAAGMVSRGYQVGILDADIHGPNVPRMLGIENRRLLGSDGSIEPVEVFKGFKAVSLGLFGDDPNKAIVWRGPLKHVAIKQLLSDVNWGDVDYLFIDLPPGTGDEPLSVANLIKNVDGSIIVTTPQEVALLDSRKAVDFSRQLKIPVLGIIENMSGLLCPKCREEINLFKVGGGLKAAKELGVDFLERIPIDPLVVGTCDSGRPIVTGNASSPAKEAFLNLIQKLINIFEVSSEKL
ncbi:MAG: Mrp/NBP35 family ATP-binding protein [Desulfobacterales bacterium]|jgi:Mrp family chromosome partitioning ATPase